MRDRAIRIIRWLLWPCAGIAAFPVLAMLGVFGLTLTTGAGNVTTAMFVAQLLCIAAVLVLTVLRLLRRRTPVWLWAALTSAIAVLTAALVVMGLNDPKAGVVIGLVLLPATGALAVLALNGLWTLLARGTEPEAPAEHHRAPESWLLRLIKWALTLLCAGSACAAAYWLITLYALFGSPHGLPDGQKLVEEAAGLLGYATVVLSVLRLLGRWWRPWAFGTAAAGYAILLTAATLMGGGFCSWDRGFAWAQVALVAVQAALHTLWSHLETENKGQEETDNDQKA